jgi:hypothetical protein|tara:strand:- start:266 stop:607 length:342 start_codon:yes stop_codon:yes gene_type:complete
MAKKKQKSSGQLQSENKLGNNPAYSRARGETLGRAKKIQGGKFKVRTFDDPVKIKNPKKAGRARSKMANAHSGPKPHGKYKGAREQYEDAVFGSRKMGANRNRFLEDVKPAKH